MRLVAIFEEADKSLMHQYSDFPDNLAPISEELIDKVPPQHLEDLDKYELIPSEIDEMKNAVYVCRRKRLTTWQLLKPLTDKMDPIAQKVVNPLEDDFSDLSYFTRAVLLKRKCQLLKVVA